MPGWRRRLEAVLQHGHGGEAAGEVRDSAVVGAGLSWALEPGSCGLAVVAHWLLASTGLVTLARGTTALDTASNIYKLTIWVHVHSTFRQYNNVINNNVNRCYLFGDSL